MQKYLTRTAGKRPDKFVAHLWDGSDTLCKQWSKNLSKFKTSKHYQVVDDANGKPICQLCQHVLDTGLPFHHQQINYEPLNLSSNNAARLEYIVGLLKSKISWRKLKETGDDSVRRLISLQEQSNPLLINPDKDQFYLGCEKLLDEILLLAK
jgi:hypothetical protein